MLAAASARPMHPGQDHSAARDRQASPLTQPPVMSGRHPLRTWRDFLGEFRACGLAISTIFPDEELEGSEVRGRGRRPGALALLHDLMVCGTGESASLGLHGSAAVAVRNRRSACSGGNMCQYQLRRSEWPAPDHLATRIAPNQPGKAGAWCATVPACSATRDWPPDRAAASEMSRVKAQRAWENSAYVRKLLGQRQPEFAAALAFAEQYFSCLSGRERRRGPA